MAATKVLFVNDSTSNPNWGDRASAMSMRHMITACGASVIFTIYEEQVFQSSLDCPSPAWAEPVERSARSLVKQLLPPGLLALRRKLLGSRVDSSQEYRFVPERWEDFDRQSELAMNKAIWPGLQTALGQADVVMIHGDGSIAGMGIHPRTLLLVAYLAKKHFNKPVVMANHTADLDNPELSKMVQNIYPLLDDIVFRDSISGERCRNICGGRVAADTAFWFEPAPRAAWVPIASRPGYFDVWPDTAGLDCSRPYVCVGGSSIYGLEEDRASVAKDYALLIRHLQSVYEGQIALVVSDRIENAIFRPLAQQLSLPLIALDTPVQQAVDLLGNADAYIGGRWQPSIFALRGGTPIVPLSAKTFKMRALMKMAGLPTVTYDALRLGEAAEGIGRQLLLHLEGADGLRQKLRSWAAQQAQMSWENVAYLRRFGSRTH